MKKAPKIGNNTSKCNLLAPATTAHNSCHNFQMRFVQKFVSKKRKKKPKASGDRERRERRDNSWPCFLPTECNQFANRIPTPGPNPNSQLQIQFQLHCECGSQRHVFELPDPERVKWRV